jgi:hypothetical protein
LFTSGRDNHPKSKGGSKILKLGLREPFCRSTLILVVTVTASTRAGLPYLQSCLDNIRTKNKSENKMNSIIHRAQRAFSSTIGLCAVLVAALPAAAPLTGGFEMKLE